MADNRNDMDNSDYSLKWNNFTSNLTCGFLSHLSDNELVDVTLAVEGRLLQAHKLVLSVCSPYFKEIFKVTPCKHPVVVLKDMGYTQVEALLRFMYKGEVNVSHHELASFLKTAETLKIKGLAGDQTNFEDVPSESEAPLPSEEPLEAQFDDSASCSNSGNIELHQKTCDENRIVKRAREAIPRSRSLTPKRNRASPPALKQMSYYNESSESVKTKSEPEDFDLSEDPYFINQQFEQYLNPQPDSNKGFSKEADDAALTEQASNSLITPPMCSQGGDIPQVVEPVTYRLSARGRPQLVHEGYVYNLTSRSEVLNRSHYRCAEQHRGCRGKCAVIAERFMPTGVHEHNHPPGYQSEYDYRKKKGLDTDVV